MIEFRCQKCGQSYRVADDYAKKRVRCKQCSTIIQASSGKSERVQPGKSLAAFPQLLQELAEDEKTACPPERDE